MTDDTQRDGVVGLAYIVVEVADLDAWRSYAREVLGVECRERGDGLDLRMDDRAFRVRLVPGTRDDVRALGWEVSGEDALRTVLLRLESAGFGAAPEERGLALDRGVAALHLARDPDGLDTELVLGPACRTDEPPRMAGGVEGFVTGELGLGHAVLAVSDMDRALRFYRECLGFRITDYIDFGVGPGTLRGHFLRCNRRHHSLALGQMPAPRRLQHFMVQVCSLDAVGFALDRARKHAAPITMGLGRHSNDRMVSFYSRSPSGFDVEYGWGGLEVDDASWSVQLHGVPSAWGHRAETE